MKLYINQKVFSWVDRFHVKDEYGQDIFYVEGEFLLFGKHLYIYDMTGAEVAYIEQKVFSFLPRYFVYINGQQVAEIVKEFSFLQPRYSIEGLGWEVTGDFFAHDYDITQNSSTIATIHKQWMTWGDCYELDTADKGDPLLALSVVLAIDCAMADASRSN